MQPYIRNRAYGTETEYGTIFQVSPGIFERCLPNGNLIDILDRKRKEGIFVRPRLWLKNGGCVYIDTGDHPEYASPECVSPKEAARYSKAGDKVVSGIFSSSQDSERRMILVKNNLASALNASDADPLVSFGFHENIQIFDMAPSDGHVRRATIPFLVSRQIIEGAGNASSFV